MPNPPKLISSFFRWFCHPDLLPSIEGDLMELFDENVKLKGVNKAKWIFMWDVIKLLRPGITKNFEGQIQLNNYGMFKNYFRMALRNAKKEKAFTLLNVFCLAIGFTACLYVSLYAIHETSYDQFHEKGERIYRINQTFIWSERDELFGSTGPGVMGAVWKEIPEFESMTRVHPLEDTPLVTAIKEGPKTIFEEDEIRAVDSTFFKVFSFPLSKGNSQSALKNPFSVILTETMALKYFNSLDIIGRQLTINHERQENTYQVTGVALDVPAKSHLTFDMLISMNSLKRLDRQNDSWWWTTFVTFGVLRADADPAFVADKVADVPAKYLGSFLMKYRGITYEEFLEEGKNWDLYIQPYLDIHLRSAHVFSRLNKTSDIKTLYVMGTIAILILLLSVINFINLTTAKSSRRGKEVGVRKVLGSSRNSLVWQFIIESVFFCFLAFVVSLGFLKLLMEQFNAISGKTIYFADLLNPSLIIITIIVALVVGVLAGIYPALYLSAFNPVKVLKNQILKGASGGLVRNALVTLQFTVSIGLIACALIVKDQVQYWMDMDLGFNRNHVIVIENVERLDQSMETFKNQLLAMPSIQNATLSTDSPPYIWDSDENFEIKGIEKKSSISFWSADENFMDIYGLNLLAGRNFDKAVDHSNGVLVTRSLIERFDLLDPQDAIGKHLKYNDLEAKIIGVVEDFDAEIGWEQLPMAIYYSRYFNHRPQREISIKYDENMRSAELTQLLVEVEEIWQSINPGMPIKYYFLDQKFQNIFQPTIQFGRMMNFYSILAMLIAGLGLTGLVAYVIERRTKEIGIRKVLGASVSGIVLLLSKEFTKLLVVGFVLASCLSWYFMDGWVQDFDVQAPISVMTFVWAGMVMLIVSSLTIGFQTLKMAQSNPVDSLKDE